MQRNSSREFLIRSFSFEQITPCNSSGVNHFSDQKKSLRQVKSSPAFLAISPSVAQACPGFGSGDAEMVGLDVGVGVGLDVGVGVGLDVGLDVGVGVGDGEEVGAAKVF